MNASFVTLGKVVRPHGVDGRLLVEYYADSPELLEKPLMLRAAGMAPRPVRLKEWQLWRGQLIIRIEGCGDRSAAEKLRRHELLIDSAFLPETEDDSPYICDLIGLEAYLPTGELAGVIEDVFSPSGQELWSIRAPESRGGAEILFPAVPEFVRSIDIADGKAVIDPPEGLIELYEMPDSSSPDEKG